jgi:long-subunit fatty acid transport protein
VKLKGEDYNTKVDYFQTTPSQITTIFKGPRINFAFSVLVPRSTKYDSAIKTKFEGYPLVQNSTVEDQETYFGPSLGFAVSQNLRMGLSLFVSKRDFKNITDSNISDSSAEVYYQESSRMAINALSAFPVLGVLYRPSQFVRLGLRFSGPSQNLSGEFDHKSSNAFGTSSDAGGEALQKKGKVNYEIPMDLGLGISVRASRNLRLLLDVSNQFKKRYTLLKEDADGESMEPSFKNVQRFNFGLEYLTSPSDALTFGLMYNPDPEKGNLNLNFLGATFG